MNKITAISKKDAIKQAKEFNKNNYLKIDLRTIRYLYYEPNGKKVYTYSKR